MGGGGGGGGGEEEGATDDARRGYVRTLGKSPSYALVIPWKKVL